MVLESIVATTAPQRATRWQDVAGAWLGIGTSPGALLLGAGLAARHQGPVPVLSFVLGFAFIAVLVWFQGRLGLVPPLGDGGNLTQVAPGYFGVHMQKLVGAMIALGMTGWLGFNLGLGAAALGALLNIQQGVAVLLLGLPILALSLGGIKGWNGLAALTTISVLVLVMLVVTQLGAPAVPLSAGADDGYSIITDMAALVGYVSVFVVRAPDFTAGLSRRLDLVIVASLLCIPLVLTILAGVNLRQGTGSADLVGVLAGPNGIGIGNLLITLAVIAPTFTTYYSGVPGLRAATGLGQKPAMFIIAFVGMALAVARFDESLLSWLSILAAVLPALLVPLAFESTRRRRGNPGRILPVWLWLSGAVVSVALTLVRHPLALLAGLFVSAAATIIWYVGQSERSERAASRWARPPRLK